MSDTRIRLVTAMYLIIRNAAAVGAVRGALWEAVDIAGSGEEVVFSDKNLEAIAQEFADMLLTGEKKDFHTEDCSDRCGHEQSSDKESV